jgi:hypothetical protein
MNQEPPGNAALEPKFCVNPWAPLTPPSHPALTAFWNRFSVANGWIGSAAPECGIHAMPHAATSLPSPPPLPPPPGALATRCTMLQRASALQPRL